MFDSILLREQLEAVLEALERIPRRFAGISRAEDFTSSPEGVDRLDAICMILIAVGEAFRKIDRKTEGKLLARYPQVDWSGVRGVRDAFAHGYFDIDAEEVFGICR
ncbi:MAG: antitoxin, partial [Armatimonadetes bacterium RBG_16_58_9]